MENDRYIRLDGYPVHEPLWKTFHLSAHAQAGGILSAVMAGANYNNPKQALIYLATGLATTVAFHFTVHPLNKSKLRMAFRDPDEKLCIDTRPDGKTPPTKPDHMKASERLRSHSLSVTMPIVGLTTIINLSNYSAVTQSILTGSDVKSLGMFSAVWGLSWLAYELSALNRFSQVVKENWIVTDTPPKVEVKQEEKVPFGFTPQFQAN